MKEIKLTQGQIALVDDDDFEVLNKFKWYAQKHGNTFYAGRCIKINGKWTNTSMHWDIMGGKFIDHRDGNGLNNHKSNLRFCTHQENLMNCRKQANTTSIYKGVSFYKTTGKWRAQITINGNPISLGIFYTEVEAAKAYNNKAIELFCEFANLNTF